MDLQRCYVPPPELQQVLHRGVSATLLRQPPSTWTTARGSWGIADCCLIPGKVTAPLHVFVRKFRARCKQVLEATLEHSGPRTSRPKDLAAPWVATVHNRVKHSESGIRKLDQVDSETRTHEFANWKPGVGLKFGLPNQDGPDSA